MCGIFCRFSVGYGSILSVTVVRATLAATSEQVEAIGVYTGAMGVGMPVPNLKTAQRVSVVFSELATTAYGKVSSKHLWLGVLFKESHDPYVGMRWAVCRRLVIGTRPTRCVHR